MSDAASVIAAVDRAANPPAGPCLDPAAARALCRVFAVGVGADVSHHLVQGVARAGNGTARLLRTGQDMRGPVLAQLRQALQPALDRVTVRWNFDAAALRLDSDAASGRAGPGSGGPGGPLLAASGGGMWPPAAPRQVPARAPPVFGGERYMSFAVFGAGTAATPPTSVTVTAQRPVGPPFSATVPVAVDGVCRRSSALRRLAAREAIRELEEAARERAGAGDRAEILQLALNHGLASSESAFVAVDGATGLAVSVVGSASSPSHSPASPSYSPTSPGADLPQYDSDSGCGVEGYYQNEGGCGEDCEEDSEDDMEGAGRSDGEGAGASRGSSPASPGGEAQGALFSGAAEGRSAVCPVVYKLTTGRSLAMGERPSKARAMEAGASLPVGAARSRHVSAKDGSDGATQICLLQRADGRFRACPALEAAAGLPGWDGAALRTSAVARCALLAAAGGDGGDGGDGGASEDAVWATALAVAALRTRYAGARAVWGLMEGKALAALGRLCPGASAAAIEGAIATVCALLDGGIRVAAAVV